MALYSLLRRRKNGVFNNYRNGQEMEHIKKADCNVMQRRRIAGAILKGRTWLIPEDIEKPDDPRHARKNNQEAINDEQYREQ